MSRYDFVNTTGAAMRQAMLQQEAQRRQAMLDEITRANQERLREHDAQELTLGRMRIDDARTAAANTAADREATRGEKIAKSTVPGLIDHSTADAIRKFNPSLVQDQMSLPARTAAIMPGTMPGATADTMAEATGEQPAQTQPFVTPGQAGQDLGVGKTGNEEYLGDSEQQQKAKQEQRENEAIATYLNDPKVPEELKTRVKYAHATGNKALIADLLKPQASDETFRTNSTRTGIEQWDGNKFVPFTGKVPKDARMLQEPQPSNASDPTWGVQIAPDGTIYRYNTKDPNTPMVAGKLPDGSTAKHVTAQTQAMMEGATMLAPHISEVDKIAEQLEKSGKFGVVASRMRDIMTKVGTIDPTKPDAELKLQQLGAAIDSDPILNQDELAGRFASELSLLASGAGRVHGGARGGGSIQMIDYLKSMLSASSTYSMFHGRLSGLKSYIDGYAKGPGGSEGSPTDKGGSGSGNTGTSAPKKQPNETPAAYAARYLDWKQKQGTK